MSFEKVKSYFATLGMEDRCISFTEPTATVAEAAAVLGVEEGRIAKTMSFLLDGKPLIVVPEMPGLTTISIRQFSIRSRA